MPPAMTPYASEAEIAEIGEGLIDRGLPAAKWTHGAHFAAVVWILKRRPDLEIVRDMPGLIRVYNEARGGQNTDESGYHETITLASIAATRAFLDAQSSDAPLHETVNALLATPLGRPDWIHTYWSRERLFCVAARRGWVDPDLRALPY
ncbi:MAG: hypothetical protein P4L64_06765 [Caulobacteraceae bacterium]|nr:hypothetical protein [Caulobacteraceae bacterium]